MDTTTSSQLLEKLKDPHNTEGWQYFVGRYRPVLVRFARRLGIQEEDAEDVAQATLLGFATAYREGRYERDRGRLRSWLFGIARNQMRKWSERRPREVQPPDTISLLEAAGADDRDPLSELWESEWRREVLGQCLEEVRREVAPATFEAFRLFALEGLPAEAVAARLALTENAVYLAKRRVLRRARELVPLMDDIW